MARRKKGITITVMGVERNFSTREKALDYMRHTWTSRREETLDETLEELMKRVRERTGVEMSHSDHGPASPKRLPIDNTEVYVNRRFISKRAWGSLPSLCAYIQAWVKKGQDDGFEYRLEDKNTLIIEYPDGEAAIKTGKYSITELMDGDPGNYQLSRTERFDLTRAYMTDSELRVHPMEHAPTGGPEIKRGRGAKTSTVAERGAEGPVKVKPRTKPVPGGTGRTAADVAQELGMHPRDVRAILRKNKEPKPYQWEGNEYARIFDMVKKGKK